MKTKTMKETLNAPSGVGIATADRALAVAALALLLLAQSARVQAQDYVWSTLAGSANVIGAADGTGSAALFRFPEGIAVDDSGTVYVADTDSHTIRKITPAGVVTTLAGRAGFADFADSTGESARFNTPERIAVDAGGNLFVADRVNNLIRRVTPAGVVTTVAGVPGECCNPSAGVFTYPNGVAVSGSSVIVADSAQTIRVVTPGGSVVRLAGAYGVAGHFDGSPLFSRFHTPNGLAVDADGNVYVAEGYRNNDIRKITPLGETSTLAGNPTTDGHADGQGQLAEFRNPYDVAIDPAGNLYVADSDNCTIRKVTPSGLVSTIGGSPLLVGAANGRGSIARFSTPRAVAVDAYGVVYVADTFNKTIRKGVPLGGRTLTPRVVAVVGQPVAGDANGATYTKLTLAQGPFLGSMKVGTKTVPAIFGGDGMVRIKVGDPAPGITGSEIVSFGTLNGDAVLAKLKPGPGGVTAQDSDVLLAGLTLAGQARLAARRGDAVITPPVQSGNQGSVVLDKIGAIDGQGRTIFFLAKLKGVGPNTDDVLCATRGDGSLRAAIRQGEDVTSPTEPITFVKTIGTLVGLPDTLAEGRWRFDRDFVCARMSFLTNVLTLLPDGLFLASPGAADFSQVRSFVSVGDILPAPLLGAKIKALGLPGCGQFGPALLATLVRGVAGVDATNDVAVILADGEGPPLVLTSKGSIPPDANGSAINDAFKAFGAPISGPLGLVAFTATLARSTGAAATGIWRGGNTASLRLLTRGGDPAPGGGRFASFTSLVLPDGPTSGVIFTGTLAVSPAEGVTAANKNGLWAVNTHGVLIGLLRTGDKIAGVASQTGTIRSFLALQPAPGSIGAANGYDNDGHVAALVTFTDNKVALVEFTIP